MIKDRMVVDAREDVGRPTRGIRLRSRRPRPARARRRWTRIDGGGLDQAVGRAEITTVQWFGQWLEQRARDGALGPRTAENYQAILRCHIEPTIGSVPLTDLSRDDVSALKGQLTSGLAPATVHKILGLLKKGLDAAVSAGVIESSPASAVSSPTVTGRMRERRALNETEIGALLRASSGTSLDVAIRFALATGIRQSELLGARWEALDLERGVFVVERSLHHVAGEFVLRTPKTRNSIVL